MKEFIKLLDSMLEILDEEKELLLNNRENELEEIVLKKNLFIESLKKFKGIDISDDKDIIEKIKEIDERQKTNLVLLDQAKSYNENFISVVKDMAADDVKEYSKDGKIKFKSNKSIIDQSL